MTFTSAITRHPIAHDAQAGEDCAALFPDAAPELRQLIAGTAGCSPYLRGLIERERDWLEAALHDDPRAVLDGLLTPLPEQPLDGLGATLRQAKRRVALYTGLADLGGVWTLEQVTGALTRLADAACDAGLKALLAPEIARGRIPGASEADLPDAAGLCVLAMGKMGAHELNYSSDIDLICLVDQDRYRGGNWPEARAGFIRVVRKLTQLLSDITGEGYVFRTDLRLRPDASSTPVVLAMEQAERYYESLGRTWERAAHIKARPCAGDLAAGAAYLDRLRPFVWRKHLDFAAIQDAYDMRLKIRDHKGLHGTGTLESRDLKLAPGGIREIEFFTQTRQLIAGGRDPRLRERGTLAGLAALEQAGWVPGDVVARLGTAYRAHREVEHRLQQVADAQTHMLPRDAEGFDRLARMCGHGDTEAFRADLRARLEMVAAETETFFAPGTPGAAAEEDAGPEPEIVEKWRSYPALRSDRAMAIFKRLKPELLAQLQSAPKPEEALAAFDGFLSGLPAGVQLFSMFEANPQLLRLITDIAATAPALARYLSHNASVLDAVIGGSFFADWPGRAALRTELANRLAAAPDYETRLDTARRWAKEWHFRTGVHHLRGLIAVDETGAQYADLAEAVIGALLPVVTDHFAEKHGAPPGRGAMVLGMGALGAGWLTAQSDLDIIVIYDAGGIEMSEGRRPLAARPYYARLTQALVTALSAPTAEGRLYEVDMRLRPSGRQGPVATALEAFATYQKSEAWTWEHLALTRARPIAGAPELQEEVTRVRADVLRSRRDRAATLQSVADMRARLAEAKPADAPLDAKRGPGRMQDIELFAQTAALLAGADVTATDAQIDSAADWIGAEKTAHLRTHYALLRAVQAAGRLITEERFSPRRLGQGGCAMMLRDAGLGDEAAATCDIALLERRLAEGSAAAAEIIGAALGPAGTEKDET